MSQENVELVRSFLPGPEVDLVALFTDDAANAQLAEAFGHLLDPAFVCFFHFPAPQPTTYSGLNGLRDGFLDWLAPWASYRTEIERLIDLGERVVLLFHTPYVFRGGSIIVPIMANKMLTHEQLKYRQQRDKSGGKPYEKQMPANFVGEVPDPLEGSDPTFAVGGSKVFEIMGWS